MAAMSISGKTPSKMFFTGTGGSISRKHSMNYQGLLPIILYSNDDPGEALTYFMARSNLVI